MGKVSQETLKASKSLAAVIEYDLIHNCYDETKAKYSSKHAAKLEVLKLPIELNLAEVWEQYKTANNGRISHTTQDTIWRKTNLALAKLSSKALEHDQIDLLIKEVLAYYSVGTIEKIVISLSTASNWAFKQKLIREHYWNNLKAKLPKRQKSKRSNECFTPDEIEAIIEGFKSNEFVPQESRYEHSYYLGYVQMLAYTGARPEEMIALTWDDIKTKHGKTTIIINKAFTHGYLKGTKTGETRIFPRNRLIKGYLLGSVGTHKFNHITPTLG